MIAVGIDPGKDGGISIQYRAGPVIQKTELFVMPTLIAGPNSAKRLYNLPEVRAILSPVASSPEEKLVVLEKVTPMPSNTPARIKMPAMSAFQMGFGAGIEWMLAGLGLPYEVVYPQRWKAHILPGTRKDKAAAIAYVQARHPLVRLLATERSRMPHDGLADATCMADYAAWLMQGQPVSARSEGSPIG